MDFGKALGIAEEVSTGAAGAPEGNTNTDAPVTDLTTGAPAPDAPTTGAPEAQSQTPNTPTGDAAPAAPQTPTIDYDKYFDAMSGGLIKTVDGFKAVLPKITEYDNLLSEKERLSAEMAKAPKFADDEVRILNDLKASGASKDQIKSFHKINEYGNISEMPDKDALIAKMVMIDGVKPSVAELKVDRDFKLNNGDLSEDEKEILTDDMRVAAVNAKKELEKFKAQASQVNSTTPEELQLQQTAALQVHQSKVVPYVKEVMASVPNLGVYYLSGKEGDTDAVTIEIPLDDATRAQLGQYVQNYLMDGLTDVTPETTREAMHYARAEYFRTNADRLFRDMYARGVSDTTEKLVNKYENRSGLREQGENPIIPNGSGDETATWMANRVNRVGK